MTMFVKGSTTPYNFGAINIRCPACRHNGAFQAIPNVGDVGWVNIKPGPNGAPKSGHHKAAMRICPNSECSALVFVAEEVGSPRTVFPPEVIDFDATNLPPRILASLEEAVKSHAAGCYRASALMVRRVLEELCEDKKATGTNLMQRLGALVWRGDLGGTCATIWMGLLCRGRCQFSTMIDAGKRSLVF